MNQIQFRSEAYAPIPLPPKYTFPQALNYLNPDGNSFYILESPDGSYVQCAGSKLRLTVEINNHQGHFRVGRTASNDTAAAIIDCSVGPISVQGNEVLRLDDAIAIFKAIFSSTSLPAIYSLRQLSDELR